MLWLNLAVLGGASVLLKPWKNLPIQLGWDADVPMPVVGKFSNTKLLKQNCYREGSINPYFGFTKNLDIHLRSHRLLNLAGRKQLYLVKSKLCLKTADEWGAGQHWISFADLGLHLLPHSQKISKRAVAAQIGRILYIAGVYYLGISTRPQSIYFVWAERSI